MHLPNLCRRRHSPHSGGFARKVFVLTRSSSQHLRQNRNIIVGWSKAKFLKALEHEAQFHCLPGWQELAELCLISVERNIDITDLLAQNLTPNRSDIRSA